MTKVFWRVDYEGTFDKQLMMENGKLAWPRGLSADDRRRLGKQMRIGHGVILAKLRGKTGVVEAVGRVTGVGPHPARQYEVSISWVELPTTRLTPDTTGLAKWKKHPIFKFSDAPAKRYQLAALIEKHVGTYEAVNQRTTFDSQPIHDLVLAALSTIAKPYPPEITDLVFGAIESNEPWLNQYRKIVAESDDDTQLVNSRIGRFVKQHLNFYKVNAGNKPQHNTLIQTYSRLAPPTNFWQRIMSLEGNVLNTLDRDEPFQIIRADQKGIIVVSDSSQAERRVQRDEIEAAWNKLVTDGTLLRTTIKENTNARNSACIAALLATMPDVGVTIRPITLHYDPSLQN